MQIMQFRLDRAGLRLSVERWNQGFPAGADSERVNKRGRILEAEMLLHSQCTEYVGRSYQQMAR